MHFNQRHLGLAALLILAAGLLAWSLAQGSLAQTNSLRFQLISENFNGSTDAGGSWLFDEGQVLDVAGTRIGYFQSVSRAFTGKGSGPNAATIQLTILFDDGTDTLPPSSITMMGTHSFDSGWQVGSVVAAGGNADVQLVGRNFEFDGGPRVLTIFQ